MIEDLINGAIDKFNARVARDNTLKKELEGMTRTVQIELKDGRSFCFSLKDNVMGDFHEGRVDNPDIKIVSDEATLSGLLNGTIRPMKAWATKKVQFKASLEDLMRIRKFF
ncbi:MAG: SCP2 sterol-binding domain-containing protein [Thermoplasmata archaeon]|uniref:SCP2 sterol-binding domain-containing protein n=1 Tax=Candidatus Sysuiplasma superficiale TaxID=2823368 RepID=A0A8J7YPV7_9ARCH|nr:SCP2 sterol-binding domain-containing protein [Candidatus Sysuiplasma superficiale]MBX8645023.1 SCP2 sterol-binding domain-containing protein [Candidatus Sysuiplasma superficiale]MCL4346841.1 SCP2 sterol-binding domain-containing protein [Candidatus Thermoplasmatota archaeon]MCL5437216.1 SCP2 sterol-binding domain-containing protein [Candidatus Thermoplasmatota archaeon]